LRLPYCHRVHVPYIPSRQRAVCSHEYGMTGPSIGCSRRAYFWSIVLLATLAFPRWAVANGGDLPPETVLQGFVKPEDGRVQLLVRLPLALLANFSLPKRGPGYLDLEHVDAKLKQAAAAAGRLIELSADGAP